MQELQKRKLRFISEIKSNHRAEYHVEGGERVKILVTKLCEYGQYLCRDVMLGFRSNEEGKSAKTLYQTQSITAYIPDFEMKVRLVKSVDLRKSCYKIFVTNELSWDAQKVLTEYSYRWMIEEFFRNAKQLFCLEEASIRSEQGGAIKFFLVSFADLLVSIQLWKSAQVNSQRKLPTVSAILAHAAEENLKVLLGTTDYDVLQRVIDSWLTICQAAQKKQCRERRTLEMSAANIDSIPQEVEGMAQSEVVLVC